MGVAARREVELPVVELDEDEVVIVRDLLEAVDAADIAVHDDVLVGAEHLAPTLHDVLDPDPELVVERALDHFDRDLFESDDIVGGVSRPVVSVVHLLLPPRLYDLVVTA